ncbi:hypothetical protein ACSAZL_18260 [Methanosarcina sp. T3]
MLVRDEDPVKIDMSLFYCLQVSRTRCPEYYYFQRCGGYKKGKWAL